MRSYQTAHMPKTAACPSAQGSDSRMKSLLIKLEEMNASEQIGETGEDHTPKSSDELPSQLVRSDLPQEILLGHMAISKSAEEKPSGVVLSDDQETIVLNSKLPAQQVADGSGRTLIEAPVAVKRIQSLDQYKAFKTQARGSYPTADFAKEEVIVLESASNLPDNVFEIVKIAPEGENLKLFYRVNVLGLGEKINTHSAQKINKSSLPIILEQVL